MAEIEIERRDRDERRSHASTRFGKGRHPARLNFADCLTYACAKVHGATLLFKGDDFSKTDINDR